MSLRFLQVLSHNVRRLRFALQSPKHVFGLPVGHHVFLYAKCVPSPFLGAWWQLHRRRHVIFAALRL